MRKQFEIEELKPKSTEFKIGDLFSFINGYGITQVRQIVYIHNMTSDITYHAVSLDGNGCNRDDSIEDLMNIYCNPKKL